MQSWYEAAQKDVFGAADDVQDAGEAEPPAAVMVPYLTVSKVSHACIKIEKTACLSTYLQLGTIRAQALVGNCD